MILNVNLVLSSMLEIFPFIFVDFDRADFGLIMVDGLHVSEITLVTVHVNFNLFFFR